MLRHADSHLTKEFDVFISHATEDKNDFVDPLARALVAGGLKIWYDEFELRVGDSLNEKINHGLAQSQYGIVVFSPSFFKKHWTQYELNGFITRQMTGERVILPIWHRITMNEIIEQAPSLADIIALNSSTQSIAQIAAEIVGKVIGSTSPDLPLRRIPAINQNSGSSFAVFYIAPGHTEELPPGEKPQTSLFRHTFEPEGWISMVSDDEELEYQIDGTRLRLRLDWQNRWQGDEIIAHQLVSQDEAFALTIRPTNAAQIYYPSVVNTSRSWTGASTRSGWMVFEIK